MFAMAQAAALATMGLAIDDYARTCNWYSTMRFGWLHPFSLELHAAGLALFGAVWLGVRWVISWWTAGDMSDTSDTADKKARRSSCAARPMADSCHALHG